MRLEAMQPQTYGCALEIRMKNRLWSLLRRKTLLAFGASDNLRVTIVSCPLSAEQRSAMAAAVAAAVFRLPDQPGTPANPLPAVVIWPAE